MKRLWMIVCIMGLTSLAHAAEPTQAEAEKIVAQLGGQFMEAWQQKQPAQMVGLFADDGWRITDTGPIIGKEALLEHWTSVFPVVNLDSTHADHVKVIGNNNIMATGHWEATLQFPGQPPHHATGYWVFTSTKQKDGTWKISMEAHNIKMSFEPAAKAQ